MPLDGASFRTPIGQTIFQQKYAHAGCETWDLLAEVLVEDVCRDLIPEEDKAALVKYIKEFKFLPGGRYLRNAGRDLKFFSNCFALRAEEDTREEWANLSWRVESCLISGGGIGVDYSVFRARNSLLKRTGGTASGPVPKMEMTNEIGRRVMQGGSRRSAIYASLDWDHPDSIEFMHAKDWHKQVVPGTNATLADVKLVDFNWPAPLDYTNISLNYNDAWLDKPQRESDPIFVDNVRQAMSTSEPGFSFNFGAQKRHTLRNACVPGDTQILTREGYRSIKDRVGLSTVIWNGAKWVEVVPFSTGVNELVEVRFSDGTSLRCTPYHKFLVQAAEEVRVEADALRPGDRLAKYPMPVVESGDDNDLPDAYSAGFYCGDGTTDSGLTTIHFPKFAVEARLKGSIRQGSQPDSYHLWSHEPMSKTFVPMNASVDYRLRWLAGLLDGDGTVTRDKNGNGFQIGSIDRDFLLATRLMLTTLGVRAKVVLGNPPGMRPLPDGKGGHKDYECQQLYRLLIGDADTHHLLKMGLDCLRCKADPNAIPQRDARRFVRVTEVVDLGLSEETFCFSDPEDSRGTFEGIVTGQCTEFITDDDSDVCNLGSPNMAAIASMAEFAEVCRLGAAFLYCGTITGLVPNEKSRKVRDANRRIGLGLMGVHEWLIQRGYKYGENPELAMWLEVYRDASYNGANAVADRCGLPRPKAYRAIAPTGTIGMIAGTTTGIEPIYAVAYMRRYLKNGTWVYQFVIDSAAKDLIERYDVDPDSIESSVELAEDVERRISFQAFVQGYVDMGISSTINLPAWGSDLNNEERVPKFAALVSKYAPHLRGLTFYADGSRGGQPLTRIRYEDALGREGLEVQEHDSCKGGVCGT